MSDRSPSPSPSLTVGDLIRNRREALGLTRDEFVRRLEPSMDRDDLYRLETACVIMPSWTRLLLICEALELSLDQMHDALAGSANLISSDGASGKDRLSESFIPDID